MLFRGGAHGILVHTLPSFSRAVLQRSHLHGLVGVGTHKGCIAQINDIHFFLLEMFKKQPEYKKHSL